MTTVKIIGIDLAKRVFHAHGAAKDGRVVFRKKLTRSQLLEFLAEQPRSVVAMEACATAHDWGRRIKKLGHTVRLIPPIYVKPFVKRQKNDAADAEAITEAASRPTMRFVEIKTVEQQERAMLFRTRDLLVRQRTQLINALRGHLAEYGVIAPQGVAQLRKLALAIEDEASPLSDLIRNIGRDYLKQVETVGVRISELEKTLRMQARQAETTARLQTMPGVGAITAIAIEGFAPPMKNFRRGRDFAAWLGLVPKQHSTGGKERLGKTSKMGQRDIRRLLIIGAMAVIRSASRKNAAPEAWLTRMLSKKPRLVVAIALANKMARRIWAMLTKNEEYRVPATETA